MNTDMDITEIHRKIQQLRNDAQELHRMGEEIPALWCNTARILASVRMLELTVSDIAEL
jgi:hypothetical protein